MIKINVKRLLIIMVLIQFLLVLNAYGMYSRNNNIHAKTIGQGQWMSEIGTSLGQLLIYPVSYNLYYGLNHDLTAGMGFTAELSIFPAMMPVCLTPFLNYNLVSNQGAVPGVQLSLEMDFSFSSFFEFSYNPVINLAWRIDDRNLFYVGLQVQLQPILGARQLERGQYTLTVGDRLTFDNGNHIYLAINWHDFTVNEYSVVSIRPGNQGMLILECSYTW